MSETILVTGGAGYIGSVTSAALIEAGYKVLVADDLSHGHRAAVAKEAEFAEVNLADPEALDRLFTAHKIASVIHFAGLIEAGESMKVPAKYFRGNTAFAINLLEAMVAHDVKKIVFSSTAAVYGNPKRTPIEEEDELSPINAYGESKLLVERMLHWFHQIHDVRFAALRYFNAAGSTATLGEDHHPETHLIPLVLDAASGRRESIAIFGSDYPTPDGTCIRDFIHVSDLATAHVLALKAMSSREKQIYNVGTGTGSSVKEIIVAASKVTGKKISVRESERRPGDPAVLVASPAKLQRELGWKPQSSSIEEILRSAWEWRQKNPDGYSE